MVVKEGYNIKLNEKTTGVEKMVINQKRNKGREKIYKKNKLFLKWLFCGLLIISTIIILTCIITKANASTSPPSNGDWIIEEGEEAELKKNHLMRGNVYIDGNLTIDGNYNLEFDCFQNIENPEIEPRLYVLVINNTGKLTMKNGATIKAKELNNVHNWVPIILIRGCADIQNSTINGVYNGICCEKNSYIVISRTTFRNCRYAVIGKGIKAPSDSTNEFIDVSFDIVQYWELKINIVNENYKPITKGKLNITSNLGNYIMTKVNENGTVNFGYIMVKEGNVNYNPFNLKVGIHEDEDNKTPHLTYEETNFHINQNYNDNPKMFKINNTLLPDFSIRAFNSKLGSIELGKTNELNVWIRNMGELPTIAFIKFSAKLRTEENYMKIDMIEDEIPAQTKIPHHKLIYYWTPTEAGINDIIVEVIPRDGSDPYPYDDNSPMKLSINVLHPPKIKIVNPVFGSSKRGMFDVTGTFEGHLDWVHVWMWDYLFSLELSYTQYLKNGKISNELNNTFQTKGYFLSNITYIKKIDDKTWSILDWKNHYRGKIVNTGSILQIYIGKFSEPYEFDDKKHTWRCKLDSGAHNGENRIIHANISGEGGMFFDENKVTINLKNEPKANINNPKHKDILTAMIENDKIYVWGYSWKATPRAPDIEDVELIIDGKKRIVILEKKNETYWKWHFEWNIASITNPVKDGNYVIQVRCTDYEERKSEVIEITVTVDNSAPYSKITIPTIKISTPEPIEPVNEEILIKGTAEDDFGLIKIEAKEVNSNWFTIIDNINKKETNWEYKWFVKSLGKGTHTIYFRAVDEETDEYIINTFYKIVSFNITKTKYILPDLSIENVVIMKNGTATTNAKNSENLTFKITIKVQNADKIPQPTTIYFKLSEGDKSVGMISKIIDKTITNSFRITIPWTVYGMKGTHNYTIELDKGNYLNEENEDNNIEKISIEILDSPPSEKSKEEDNILSSNFKSIIFSILVISTIIFIFILLLNKKKFKGEKI